MGTHPLGMSELNYEGRQISLAELVERYPLEVLGKRAAAAFANQFPFLLKVLSANEPLSIQVHPSKEQAAILHQKDPAHYPDANHKPEIAIALEQLRALAGLRDARQVGALMKNQPELSDFVGFSAFSRMPKQERPKLAFLSLLRKAVEKPDELTRVIHQLVKRLREKDKLAYREKLFLSLSETYPGDVGLLCIFFLKLLTLNKGQAIYIPAGVPHAYLKGNIVECMASSDNVIRAGLTPKFKDIPILLEVVTDEAVVVYSPETANYVYSTPASEFRVSRMGLETGQKIMDSNDSVRLMLVLRGRLRLTWQSSMPHAGTGTTSLEAVQGESVLLPASLGQVGIECVEASEMYVVDVSSRKIIGVNN
jgi:mannose-6-phosphate isomerase